MGRPRVYDTPHFCLHTYVRKGHTYVEAYRNEWETLPYRTKKVRRSLGYRDRKSSARKEISFREPTI